MPKIRKDFITAALADLKDVLKVIEYTKSWLQSDLTINFENSSLDYFDIVKSIQEKETAGEKYITLLETLHDNIYCFLDLILSYIESFPIVTDSDVKSSNVIYLSSMSLGTLVHTVWSRLQAFRRGIAKLTVNVVKITGNICFTDNGTQTDVCLLQQCTNCTVSQSIVRKFINIVHELFKFIQTIGKTKVSLTEQSKLKPKELLQCTDWSVMQTLTKSIEQDLKCYLRTMKQYRDKNEAMKKTYDEKIKDMELEMCTIKNESTKQNAKMENIIKTKSELELELYKCKSKLEYDSKARQKLEIENESLQVYCVENTKLVKTICSLEAELQRNITKCNTVYQKFQETEMHTEALISNNKKVEEMLNAHIDELKTRYSESADIISKLESYTDEKDKTIEELQGELEILKKRFKISEEENTEKNIKIQDMELQIKEHEKKFLILLYNPDFFANMVSKKVECEPIRDMENQIEANEARIELLSKHNEHLRNVLQKLKSRNEK